jgi:hypothetical protein
MGCPLRMKESELHSHQRWVVKVSPELLQEQKTLLTQLTMCGCVVDQWV